MATVIQVPGDPRFGRLGAGLSQAVGTGFEAKRKEDERKELANWIQEAQVSPDRDTLISKGVPTSLRTPEGTMRYASLIEAIHPRKHQEYVQPKTGTTGRSRLDLEYSGRFEVGKEPQGAIPLDVAEAIYYKPTTAGARPTDTDKLVGALLRNKGLARTQANVDKSRLWVNRRDKIQKHVDDHIKSYNKDPAALFSDRPEMQAQRNDRIQKAENLFFDPKFKGTAETALKQILDKEPIKLIEQPIPEGKAKPKDKTLGERFEAFFGGGEKGAAPTPDVTRVGTTQAGEAIVLPNEMLTNIGTDQKAQVTAIRALMKAYDMSDQEAVDYLNRYLSNGN